MFEHAEKMERHRHVGRDRQDAAIDAPGPVEIAAAMQPHRQIDRVGLGEQTSELAGNLPLGQQRVVEIARALCIDPALLLLDEPAAGLDSTESLQLGERLRAVVDHGVTMLLVDHDMGLVLSVCEELVVLDFGRRIAGGNPQQVREDPRVIEAYLGQRHDAATPEGAR